MLRCTTYVVGVARVIDYFQGLLSKAGNRSGWPPFAFVEGLEGRVIVERYKGRGREARAKAVPRQRFGLLYRVFMRLFFGSRRMRL